MSNVFNKKFVNEIKDILSIAKERVITSINIAMVYSYYEIGRRIVMEEQKGKSRADYGKELIELLSRELTKEFGRGYSISNLQNIRRFYLIYSQDQIMQPVVVKSKDESSLTANNQIPQPVVRESKDKLSLTSKNQIGQPVFIQSKDKMSLNNENQIGQPVVIQSKDNISLIEKNKIPQPPVTEFKVNKSLMIGGSIRQPVVAKSKDKLSLSKENKIGQTVVDQSKDNISLIEEDQILQTVFANSKDEASLTDKNQIQQTVFDESKDVKSLHQYDIEGIDKYPLTSDGRRFFLSWVMYVKLMRITNPDERHFYEIECYNNKWSKRELERQYNSSLYERLVLSRDKDKVRELSTRGQIIEKPRDLIKEPCVLEFLELKEDESYSEKDLETKIINKLQDFVLELGKGFIFVKRQMRISFEDQHFYPDLVFYNRFLRCFVIIDLKVGTLHPPDIGQMEMYVNYFDRYEKSEEENKTIGILLCKDKNDAMVKLTLPEDNDQIYASKYEMILPSKQDLIRLIKEK